MSDEIDISKTSRIDLLKVGIAAEIKRIMPKLRTVEPLAGRFNLDQLSERSIKAPAAFPTVLKSPAEIRANRSLWLQANCACFFVAEGGEDKRNQQCWAMAEGFISILSNNMFGLTQVSVPDKIDVDPLISVANRRNGVTIIAVTWTQTIKAIGDGLFNDEKVMLKALYLNDDEDPHHALEEAS
jgi:hypothetical protein